MGLIIWCPYLDRNWAQPFAKLTFSGCSHKLLSLSSSALQAAPVTLSCIYMQRLQSCCAYSGSCCFVAWPQGLIAIHSSTPPEPSRHHSLFNVLVGKDDASRFSMLGLIVDLSSQKRIGKPKIQVTRALRHRVWECYEASVKPQD